MTGARKGDLWKVIAGEMPLPPVLGLLGWSVVDAEQGRVRARFVGRKEFYNPGGFVQGGILAAMLDGVMGAAAVSLLGAGERITTLEMKVSYMQSVRDVPLMGEGWVVHRGGSVLFMEGTLTAEDGSLVATATATGRVVRPPSKAADREEVP
jgi:uncharacterized protein (TIGR00369 family)